MCDDGEPVSRGRPDRRAADARRLRNALVAVALFTGAVLVSGIAAILGIEWLEMLGVWPRPDDPPSVP